MIPLRAYLPTGAKWTCAARIQRAIDPQRTSLARCHLPASGSCICDRRSVFPAVLQFALFTPQSLALACFCPPTLYHPFEPGSVLHPLLLLFFFFFPLALILTGSPLTGSYLPTPCQRFPYQRNQFSLILLDFPYFSLIAMHSSTRQYSEDV